MLSDEKILGKKVELIQWLLTLEDKSVIDKLMEFRKSECKGIGGV